MLSQSPNWIREIQKLNGKSEGQELRDQLVACIEMCNASHAVNVGLADGQIDEIIEWGDPNFDCPPGRMPALPTGWEEDPSDHTYKEVPVNG